MSYSNKCLLTPSPVTPPATQKLFIFIHINLKVGIIQTSWGWAGPSSEQNLLARQANVVIFNWGCLPLMSFSIEVVFQWGHPLKLFGLVWFLAALFQVLVLSQKLTSAKPEAKASSLGLAIIFGEAHWIEICRDK